VSGAPLTAGTGSFHTRRLDSRRATLKRIFSPSAMEFVWKKYVRPGFRDQEIFDLHDYNDFHWNRFALFESLSATILAGQYVPTRSIPVRVEKKQGISRTLVIPAPEDAVILQCIVESLLPDALARQPSSNAFFSRSHGFAEPEWRFHRDYIWFRRWAKFAKMRFSIASTHTHVCTTDIANYFDNIDYTHLRNMIAELPNVDEVTLDILFNVLDTVSWRPDYLPPPQRSLPQVNFDAPRLLSHIYLYEIDEYLKARVNNSFVRWVDDITVAAQSATEAKEILRDLDQLLLTRGLRLNIGKTQVLSARDARRYFQQTQNTYLDDAAQKIARNEHNPYRLKLIRDKLRKQFDSFAVNAPHGHSEKIIKRYLTLFTKLGDNYALDYCYANISAAPAMRDSLWRYFIATGPSKSTFRSLKKYILGDDVLDDASVFQIALVLISWEVKPLSRMHKSIKALGVKLGQRAYTQRSPFNFVASLWILTKYGVVNDVAYMLEQNARTWQTSEFLSRQVAGVLPKFRRHAAGRKLESELRRHQFDSTTTILSSLSALKLGPKISSPVRLYAVNGGNRSFYSIQRFLISLHILTSKSIDFAARSKLRSDIVAVLTDPIYIKVLKSIKIAQ
jgi:reverse transcriptase-like protein